MPKQVTVQKLDAKNVWYMETFRSAYNEAMFKRNGALWIPEQIAKMSVDTLLKDKSAESRLILRALDSLYEPLIRGAGIAYFPQPVFKEHEALFLDSLNLAKQGSGSYSSYSEEYYTVVSSGDAFAQALIMTLHQRKELRREPE